MKPFDLSKYGNHAIQRLTLYGNIITFVGNQGSVNIDINGHVKVATFDTDLTTTADNFVFNNYEYYRLHGFILTADTGVLTVTSAYGWGTINNIVVTVTPYIPDEASPTTTPMATTTGGVDLTAIITGTLEIDFLKARIWKVAFDLDISVANPVNPTDGDRIRIELTTDVASRITWGDKWDFVGTDPYVLDNALFSVIEGVYDAVVDTVICTIDVFEAFITTTL